jgi:hypothetical protein
MTITQRERGGRGRVKYRGKCERTFGEFEVQVSASDLEKNKNLFEN